MNSKVGAQPDPRDPTGPFGTLLSEIRACKNQRTCSSLRSRSYYFEPNPITAGEWQAARLFCGPLDRRVVFVCESPGPQFNSVNNSQPSRCWSKTWQDERFRRVRAKYGFLDCYLTNTVKCGVRSGAHHSRCEVESCRGFLLRELCTIRPQVVVAVGGNAWRTLRSDVLPLMGHPPLLFKITHYSARRDVWARWRTEFTGLQSLIAGP